jgi:hypothetical protein
MLHCIKIKEKFCALHDEKGSSAGQTHYGDLAHGLGPQGVYRAVALQRISTWPDPGLSCLAET